MFDKIYDFNNSAENILSFGEMKDICYNLLHAIHSIKNEWCIVLVKHTSEVGEIQETEVYFLKSYASDEAAKLINKYEYSSNTAVDVYEINEEGYILMLDKCFDGMCYTRPAGCSFNL